MSDQKLYVRKFTVLSPWAIKALGLVIAGAATTIVALTITKHVSIESDSAQSGRTVADWHEAVTIPSTVSPAPGAFASGSAPESSPHTIVHNGLTVVSPQLLVPAIDLAALQEACGSGDKTSASKTSSTRKRYRQARRSQGKRQTQWKAYGLAIR